MKFRNLSLYFRMGTTMIGLAVTYIVFLAVLSMYISSVTVLALIAGVGLLFQYFYSDKIALKTARAERVSPDEYPQLHEQVERLAMQADIPKPDVAVSQEPISNAFAAGRNQSNSVVCVTEELLTNLTTEELDAVLAHEISHIKNRDAAVLTIASFFSTIAFFITRYGLYSSRNQRVLIAVIASFVVWIISTLLIRGLSRYREYTADRGAAELTGNPVALASALKTISGINESKPTQDLREQSGLNAFYFAEVSGSDRFTRLLSTHPPTEDRIEQLQEMAREQY